ncbi:MAG: DEAD/DEAH box helicase [Planctomycetaceae bacterium]
MKTFEELSLIEPIAQALKEARYVQPTPIQAQTIPSAIEGRDVLGCAQTGTGKTAAFSIPILDRLGRTNRKSVPRCPQALVLAPTRELAVQIGENLNKYGKNLQLRTTLVYGGVSQGKQVRAMQRGTHILVATPGRLLDLIEQGYIDLSKLSFFVLDEADRMLDMGFLPAIRRVISMLPDKRQSLFFSATLAPNIVKLSQSLLREPVTVNVTPKKTSVAKITQRLIYTQPRGKKLLLQNTLSAPEVERALVFTRTKRGANVVARILRESDIPAAAIHGNKSQNARERALAQFRAGRIKVLVATDVASRGIDIKGVTHVVNYDLPREPEAYVHRIGRTGRAGAEGIAIAFCTADERSELRAIERLIGHKLPAENAEPAQSEESASTKKPRRRRKPASKLSSGAGGKASAKVSAASTDKPKSQRRRRRRKSRRGPAPQSKD